MKTYPEVNLPKLQEKDQAKRNSFGNPANNPKCDTGQDALFIDTPLELVLWKQGVSVSPPATTHPVPTLPPILCGEIWWGDRDCDISKWPGTDLCKCQPMRFLAGTLPVKASQQPTSRNLQADCLIQGRRDPSTGERTAGSW